VIAAGWTFVRDGNPRLEGSTDFCWCPVVRKEHPDGSVSEGQFLNSPGENCIWHGLRKCKGCGEVVWAEAHYVCGVNPHTGESDFTSFYRCVKARNPGV